MKIFLLYFLTAVGAYLLGAVNPSIIVSRRVYHVDLREYGSHNAGFTNFKRLFGNRVAWFIFACDILKAALVCLGARLLFQHVLGRGQLGAAYACLFAMLGHSFPVWYGFRGGKGAAVYGGSFWFVDWRVTAVGFVVCGVVLVTTRYMSLAAMLAALSTVVLLALTHPDPAALLLSAVCAAVLILRHRENIVRLCTGGESKFRFHDRPKDDGAA